MRHYSRVYFHVSTARECREMLDELDYKIASARQHEQQQRWQRDRVNLLARLEQLQQQQLALEGRLA